MIINEIFKSLQGEGRYTGYPVLFIRLSGCTRKCSFCDTQYHINGRHMPTDKVIRAIKKSKLEHVVWTGGEPMLQQNEIYEVIKQTIDKHHSLETNGDIFPSKPGFFDYIAFSPKEKKAQDRIISLLNGYSIGYDIKIVTDLDLNKNMLRNATMLMPLTTGDYKKDLQIQQKVWNYCIKHKLKYTPRIHRDVWSNKRGV